MNTADMEVAWAAGLFDGEGCVHIGCIRPTEKNRLINPSYRLSVRLAMTDRRPVDRFHRIVGAGTIQRSYNKSLARAGKRFNTCWVFVAQARKAESVLKVIRPYLYGKAKEADIGLEFMTLPDVKRGGYGGSPSMLPALLKRKHALHIACARLKSRYRFRVADGRVIKKCPKARRGRRICSAVP